MPDWDAELVIDEALVRALLAEQFPELDAASARLFGEGWDNAVWVVEEEWAFRFPRRAIAIAGVERELAILPRLAPLLAVPIPVPTFVGQRSDRFPWPFFGSRLLPGREVADAALGDEARVALGTELGQLLRALHEPELRGRVDPDDALPVDLEPKGRHGQACADSPPLPPRARLSRDLAERVCSRLARRRVSPRSARARLPPRRSPSPARPCRERDGLRASSTGGTPVREIPRSTSRSPGACFRSRDGRRSSWNTGLSTMPSTAELACSRSPCARRSLPTHTRSGTRTSCASPSRDSSGR